MSTDERLDYLERQLTAIADYVVKQDAPKPKPQPKQQKASPFWVAALIVIVLMIVAWFGLNFAAAFNLFVPPGWQQPTTAEPLPTAAVYARPVVNAPVSAPQPRSEAQPAQGGNYTLTVPPYQAGAWTPDGPFVLDVAGRRYRALGQQGGATFAELDDGTRVWLGTAAVAGPEAAQPAVAEPQPAATAPPIGPVDTWGPGGTTGGSTWGEPTALPLQNAIIPAMPVLDAPTPTWGEGGSTGGATW